MNLQDYATWGPHQPDNHYGEDCVYLAEIYNGKLWNDRPCGDQYGYICKKGILRVRLRFTNDKI